MTRARSPRLPRHRPSPGQLVIPFHLHVLDGGGRSTPMRAQLTVIEGGIRTTPEPTPIVALRKAA